jgi:RimK family alpha-L-glutamate ligase
MSTFAVVACRSTPTNRRLGTCLTPSQAVARLRPGDVALGRIDVLDSSHAIEPGLWALDLLEQRGITMLNRRATLEAAHDKLTTAAILAAAGIPHPSTVQVAPWLPVPELDGPVVLKPRFGSLGRDVIRCETAQDVREALSSLRLRVWFNSSGGVLQSLVAPRGWDLRILVAGGAVVGAVKRVAARGEWRTNVALGARRVPVVPPLKARDLALAAAAAIDGDLVGIDLLPLAGGGWTVLELNGAVDFNGAYSLGAEVFSAARTALLDSVAHPCLEPDREDEIALAVASLAGSLF